jgi:hypothetical protein
MAELRRCDFDFGRLSNELGARDAELRASELLASLRAYEIPDAPSGDARADLALLAWQGLAAARRHPWVPGLIMVRTSMGPNALRCTEFFLSTLADSGLDGRRGPLRGAPAAIRRVRIARRQAVC